MLYFMARQVGITIMSEDTKTQRPAMDAGAFGREKEVAGERGGKKKGRRKVSYLTVQKIEKIDYKDVALLRRFLNERWKIQHSRQSGNTAGQQRMIVEAIKRAREMALLPYVASEMSNERAGGGARRERPPRDGKPYEHREKESGEPSEAATTEEA